jgi:hypothetical protein
MQHTDSATVLSRLVATRKAHLIAVDGAHGSGKSTLAKALARELSAEVIEADQFLTPHQGSYLHHLDYEAISNAVKPATPCILEGICLRQVAAAAGLVPEVHIYVKRTARWGWADESELSFEGSVESHLQRLKANVAPFVDAGTPVELGLWEEVIRYHATYRPHENCDFVYLRGEA